MPAAIWSGRDGHSEKVTADIAQALGTELGLALHRSHARTWPLGTQRVLDLAARVESALRQRRTREGGS
ncbi:hypothetical protein [Streptomyces sp. NRRL S-337]|uniref:hypothetical protein n=1 Tax=Streptomyces sp. NRRL S-337 TaxID=1463900 RepID=UPI0004CC4CB9|nr:hypothetical protein [Streptomyces sp. NRRL S-337]